MTSRNVTQGSVVKSGNLPPWKMPPYNLTHNLLCLIVGGGHFAMGKALVDAQNRALLKYIGPEFNLCLYKKSVQWNLFISNLSFLN